MQDKREVPAGQQEFLRVNPDGIPVQLKSLPRWLAWRGEPGATGTTTKIPYCINGHGKASSTDPTTWVDFPTALAGMNGHSGLGFALAKDITFIDLDHVRNPQTGEIAEWATAIVAELDSYSELSPSGDGVHVYTLGALPGPGIRREFSDGSALEIYDRGRYMTVTGHHLTSTPEDIREADVATLYHQLKSQQLGPSQDRMTGPLRAHPIRCAQTEDSSVRALLKKWGLAIKSETPYQGTEESGFRFVLAECPFNPEHQDAAVFDFPVAPVFTCFHHSCRDNAWRELQQKFEPTPNETWRQNFITTENGQPKGLVANALTALRHDPKWQGMVGYNAFSLSTIFRRQPPWSQVKAGDAWTDAHDTLLAEAMQHDRIPINPRIAAEAIEVIARENSFNPLQDYLGKVKSKWDCAPRVERWLVTYLGAVDSPYVRAIGQRWLISACARAWQPGCQADHVLSAEGPQGIRKTTAFRTLASADWFSDHISELGSKDSRLELAGRWIVELSELDRVRRGDLERVKAFITTRIDIFRPPYGRRTVAFPRSNVFCATTNDSSVLLDESGNRRWWCFRCGHIDIDALARDREMIWGEAQTRYEAGENWWLESPELITAAHQETEKRYLPGTWDDEILAWCEQPRRRTEHKEEARLTFDSSVDAVTINDILLHGIGKSLDKITQGDRLQVQRCLTHAGWKQQQIRVKDAAGKSTGRVLRFYLKPGVNII